MKKDIQRAAFVAIIGTLVVITGCDRSDGVNMKGREVNRKLEKHDIQKPQPHKNSHMDETHSQMQNRAEHQTRGGNGSKRKTSGSQYYRRGN
jgi:Zn-finger nucleic acid-binding protein